MPTRDRKVTTKQEQIKTFGISDRGGNYNDQSATSELEIPTWDRHVTTNQRQLTYLLILIVPRRTPKAIQNSPLSRPRCLAPVTAIPSPLALPLSPRSFSKLFVVCPIFFCLLVPRSAHFWRCSGRLSAGRVQSIL